MTGFFLLTVFDLAEAAAEMVFDRTCCIEVAAEAVQAQLLVSLKIPDGHILSGFAEQRPDKRPCATAPQVRGTRKVMKPEKPVLIDVFLGRLHLLFEEPLDMPAMIVIGHLVSEIHKHSQKHMAHEQQYHDF